MTPDEREIVRKLLMKYQATLSLAEDLALTVLDTLQPEQAPPDHMQTRERRKAMGDALAMIESGDEFAAGLWIELDLERRAATEPAHLPHDIPRERRKHRKRAKRGAGV